MGLTSIDRLLVWIFNKMSSDEDVVYTDKWRCVSYNGAFYVKYVTTSTFVGLSIEILRPDHLILYIVKLLWAKSAIQRHAIRKVNN